MYALSMQSLIAQYRFCLDIASLNCVFRVLAETILKSESSDALMRLFIDEIV